MEIWTAENHWSDQRMSKFKSIAQKVHFSLSGQRALNRNLCFELITIAFGKTRRFGMPAGHELVYDCKAIMVFYIVSTILIISISLHPFHLPNMVKLVVLIWR